MDWLSGALERWSSTPPPPIFSHFSYTFPVVVCRSSRARRPAAPATWRPSFCRCVLRRCTRGVWEWVVHAIERNVIERNVCFQCKEFDEAVDVYSFGVLCWEMMTGLEPWGHVTDPKEIVRAPSHITRCTSRFAHRVSQLHLVVALQQRPPLPEQAPPSYPPAYVAMIQRCWAQVRAPSHRHTSHVTRHTSHVTRHTSHVTRHTSLVTGPGQPPHLFSNCARVVRLVTAATGEMGTRACATQQESHLHFQFLNLFRFFSCFRARWKRYHESPTAASAAARRRDL